METLLIAVTVISLGLAVTMSVVAWTLLKADRQRAAARIEALEALAFSDEPVQRDAVAEPVHVPVAAAVAEARRVEPASSGMTPTPNLPDWDATMRVGTKEEGGHADVAPLAGRVRALLPDAMFGTEPASNASTRRWLAVAAVGALVAAGYVTASALRSPEVVAALAAAPPLAVGTEPQPLELLSLKHTTDANDGFTVSGFVQNPTAGRRLTNVEAVVYLFDQQDQYFMTGRASLETADLRSGADSTFQVHVPGATNIGRYRLGFRQADGTVVIHVDRRGQFPEGTSETVLGPEQARPAGGLR